MTLPRSDCRVSRAFALLLLLLGTPALAAPMPSSCWRELHFVAGNLWASATSTLRYATAPAQEAVAQLQQIPDHRGLLPGGAETGYLKATFEAMRSHGESQIWFDPATGAVLQARRIGHGADSRLKTWRFLDRGVWRERRAPAEEPANPDPLQWELRSRGLLPYPPEAATEPVITPLMLIARATDLAREPQRERSEHLVLLDSQFYRVGLRSRPDDPLEADFTLLAGASAEQFGGERAVRRVRLSPQLLGDEEEEEAFSLLELDGEISIYVDEATGLPLRIEGTWMRVGVIPVALDRARVDERCRR